MEFWHSLSLLVLLLGVAFVFGALAQRLKQSAIIGYLLAGTILGPAFFDRPTISQWGELGVSLLLFSIGLEFSFRRLRNLGAVALLGGTLQVVLTLALFALLFAFTAPAGAALAWGAVAAVSSTAIVLRVLMARAEIDSVPGRTALGILLLQDIAVVPLVLSLTLLSSGGTASDIALHAGRTVAAAGGLVAVFYVLFYHLIPRVLMRRGVFADRELVVLLAIVLAFGSSWVAHRLGLSPALGAFLAGMLLAESPFAVQIRSDIGSLRTLFVTLFFTSVGMLADPGWFAANWVEVLGWLAVVFIGKALIIYGICLMFKMSHAYALASGITLAQVGEFSFVLATVAKDGGLVGADLFALMVSVTILSMFLAPYMVAYARPLADWVLGTVAPGRRERPAERAGAAERTTGRCFVVGFGPSGRRVAEALLAQGIAPEVIELNPQSAAAAREIGLHVHLGDASGGEVVAHAGIRGACVVAVTIPDPRSARAIIQNVRVLDPNATVVARCRYHIAEEELRRAGADVVVDEEDMVGQELARQVVAFLRSVSPEDVACALPPDDNSVL
jgi:CPA2 family monovalent cation:H+ antiporter-2